MSTHTFLVSDQSENSHGLTVKTGGIDLTRFEKNPIMLYNHDRTKIIGRWENLEIKEDKLYADAVFDETDAFGKEIARKVKENFIKATSLGIVYSPFDVNETSIEKSALIEISIVPVGSNANTLKMYDSLSLSEYFVSSSQSIKNIGRALNLGSISSDTIISEIHKMQADNKVNIEFKETILQERKEEAEKLIKEALKYNVLPEHLKELQLKEFETNYINTRKHLKGLIAGVKKVSLSEMVENSNRKAIKKSGKPKAEWSLEDYRRFAPDELKQDYQLFLDLVNETYHKQ